MLHKKSILLIIFSLLFVFGVWTVAAGSLVNQQAVLSGEVVSAVAVEMCIRDRRCAMPVVVRLRYGGVIY